METGADDTIIKPIPFRKLVEKVLWYGQLGRQAVGDDVARFLAGLAVSGKMRDRSFPVEVEARL